MDFAYEKKLKKIRDRVEVAASAIDEATEAINDVANTLIHQDAPHEIENAHADLVDAGARARDIVRQVADVASQAGAVAKSTAALGKIGGKIDFASRRLLSTLIKRAEAEERRRRDRQTSLPLQQPKPQQEAESGDPCRAPRDIPGLDEELLDEVAEELAEGQALTIQVLGYQVALREGDAFTVDDRRIEIMIAAIAAEDAKVELTKAERWAFRAGVNQAVQQMAQQSDDGTPFTAPAGCGAAHASGGGACRLDPGHEGLHDNGTTEWATPAASAAAETIVGDTLGEALDELAQQMDGARATWLGMARDRARDDAAAGQKIESAEALAKVLDVPEANPDQVLVTDMWLAYVGVLDGRGRPKGSTKKKAE